MGQLGSRYPTCIGAGLHKGFGDNGVGDVGPSHEGPSPHQSLEVIPDLTFGRRGLGMFVLSFDWPWPDPKVPPCPKFIARHCHFVLLRTTCGLELSMGGPVLPESVRA